MAYVSVPKDLTHVKSKVLFGLTKRQIVCFGAALLMGELNAARVPRRPRS